jgi:inosine-uridine nucleoside N-ribohydrolase
MKKKIILDVDTGSDDAIAVMLAGLSEELDLIGISTVNGNRNIDITTTNTLRLVDYLDFDVPVYRGCHLPMVVSLSPNRRKNVPYTGPENKEEDVHGDYLPLPETTRKEEKEHAVFWLARTLTETTEKITLVFVGPLTNLAMALRIAPSIVENIEEIVIMGGGYQINNVTAGAEFNFWIDPEAAKIVTDCGASLRIVPLDATHDAYISWEDSEEMLAENSKASKFCGLLMQQRISGYNLFQPLPIHNTAPIHDALAVAALIDPEVLQDLHEVNMDVCVSQGIADGWSLFDFEKRNRARKPNCTVALRSDRERFVRLLKENLRKSK